MFLPNKHAIEIPANKIKWAREARGLSQRDLSELTGFSQSFISHVETQKKNITLTKLYHIAKCLSVSIHDLIEEGDYLCSTRFEPVMRCGHSVIHQKFKYNPNSMLDPITYCGKCAGEVEKIKVDTRDDDDC